MNLDYAETVVYGILLLSVIGIVLQVRSRIYYTTQIKYAHRLRARIEELLAQDKTGYSSSYKARDILEELSIPITSSVGERCIELEGYADYSGMVALHDLAAEEADSDDGRFSNSFPNLLISSLLVAGLLGTLLSLKETLESKGMTEFITKEGMATASSFQEALRPVVEGFGHAFKASIAGVGCTLFLIVSRLLLVRNAREKCFKAVEKLVVNQLLRFFVKPSQDSLREASQLLSKGGGIYSEAVSSIEAAATTVAESVDGLDKAAEQANRAFGEEGAIAGVLAQLTEQVGALGEAAAAIGKSEKEKTDALKELTYANEKLHEKVAQRSQELAIQHAEVVAMVGEKTQALGETQTELIKQIKESAKSQGEKQSAEHAELVAMLGEQAKALSETQTVLIKEVKESTKAQGEKQSNLLAEMKRAIGDLASQLEKHPGSIEQLAELKNETIGTISATLRQQTQDFDSTIQTLQASLSEYPISLNGSIGKLEAAVKESHQNVGAGWNDLTNTLKEARQQNLQVSDAMTALGRNLEKIVKRTGGGPIAFKRWWRFWEK